MQQFQLQRSPSNITRGREREKERKEARPSFQGVLPIPLTGIRCVSALTHPMRSARRRNVDSSIYVVYALASIPFINVITRRGSRILRASLPDYPLSNLARGCCGCSTCSQALRERIQSQTSCGGMQNSFTSELKSRNWISRGVEGWISRSPGFKRSGFNWFQRGDTSQ